MFQLLSLSNSSRPKTGARLGSALSEKPRLARSASEPSTARIRSFRASGRSLAGCVAGVHEHDRGGQPIAPGTPPVTCRGVLAAPSGSVRRNSRTGNEANGSDGRAGAGLGRDAGSGRGKMAESAAKRDAVACRRAGHRPSERRGRLRVLANERRGFGGRRLFGLLRGEGEPFGINRLPRPCREKGLTLRKRKVRRRAVGTRPRHLAEARPDACRSPDFVHDRFADGWRVGMLKSVDDVPRECLAVLVDTSTLVTGVAPVLCGTISPRVSTREFPIFRAAVRRSQDRAGPGSGWRR